MGYVPHLYPGNEYGKTFGETTRGLLASEGSQSSPTSPGGSVPALGSSSASPGAGRTQMTGYLGWVLCLLRIVLSSMGCSLLMLFY